MRWTGLRDAERREQRRKIFKLRLRLRDSPRVNVSPGASWWLIPSCARGAGFKKTWADHWGLDSALALFNPGPIT